MPANLVELSKCLSKMKEIYTNDAVASVRSQAFINILHDYCIDELKRAGINVRKFTILKEATLYGSHKQKDVDIAVIESINGPQILIGVRSQMSSVSKNILTYYEEIIGDCISLHDRFPMAVINYVYLIPNKPLKSGLEKERIDLERAEKLFKLIAGRKDWRDAKDKYEHFAFLKVDFTQDPPKLFDTCDELNIEKFFDRIIVTYNERNIYNLIGN